MAPQTAMFKLNYSIKTFALLILFGLTFASCDSMSDQRTDSNSDITTTRVTDTVSNISVVMTFEPGISLFSHLVDSAFSQSKEIISTYRVDTMTAEMTDYRDTRTNLFTSDNVIVKKYSLENSIVHVDVVEAIYPDDKSTIKAFRQTRTESKQPLGLSAGNDFVIKSDKKIYWLMSQYTVRLNDHQVMKYLMTKAWNISSIQDSINWSNKDK